MLFRVYQTRAFQGQPMSKSQLTVITILLLLGVSAQSSDPKLAYLAYGDLRGYLEPCGCDPKSDLGGAKRMMAVLERERSLNPNLALFDLGNNVKFDGPLARLKAPFILEATSQYQPDAVLWNKLEEEKADAVAKILTDKKMSLPYVRTYPPSPHKWVKPMQSTSTGQVFGYVADGDRKTGVTWLREKVAKAPKAKRRFLLFAGGEADLREIAELGLFDVIVSASAKPMDYAPGGYERDDISQLVRLVDEKLGAIRSVSVGGQGLLRGGSLTTSEAKPLAELFGNNPVGSPAKNSLPLPSATKELFYTWLGPDQGGDELLPDLFKRYQAATEKQFQAQAAERLSQLKDSLYVGAETCQGCHADSYAVWKESSHAQAIATLQQVGKDRDPECVTCHVVGGDKPGGFVDMKHSPHLANVQCETCHGPRKEHVQNPTVHPKLAVGPKEVCVSCHHPPHSTAFDFESYWEKIKHGKEAIRVSPD